ncbi:selenocysteine-specific elongation factor [Candidatus Hakubella thermalkaliphila]|uniref:Selenocysteine-specific elongation factor n=3 Tax=Candidatus Hakubella thermalkaliphila TaxID=2754717 RepID=A0A6V8QBH6_9ACTN|nr:selenocysteine-specific translation elongation factor [Candidatus Hakubella thermalkaliphila]GFP19434.1 selenocysteine-specific elongation factor [Candidatus Hakubella thermalkaliphila]GFP39187.1 selenocysteine-specific elongation factor [Candidatus Hakubella thermalkaliphila]GFP42129.1 selenocysteine-specific elongation factor [Candidatus Hakubella thermalkaliphila]
MGEDSFSPYIIIGTAGHIDHGKTELVKRMTGTDTDRLKEEKQRGISIDIGFAELKLPSGRNVAIIDVPGHERFVKNMLAGSTGVDIGLLVVAADDGVMPQTREHLAILELLGIKRLVVALTKIDLVDKEWQGLIEEQIRDFLRDTAFADAPLVSVSSRTGENVDVLIGLLDELSAVRSDKEIDPPLRMPIDRVFSLSGIGTVVTGTLWSGTIEVDQTVEVLPGRLRSRVRSIQVFNRPVPRAFPAQRVALNLVGAKRDELSRGDVIVSPASFSITYVFDARVRILKDVGRGYRNRSPVRIYHGTRETEARMVIIDGIAHAPRRTTSHENWVIFKGESIKPGQEAYVQIRMIEPLVLRYQDRFVLRSYSPITTIGGGVMLDIHPPKYRKKSKDWPSRYQILEEGTIEQLTLFLFQEKDPLPLSAQDIVSRFGLRETEVRQTLQAMLSQGKVVELGKGGEILYLLRSGLDSLEDQVINFISQYLRENPLQRGVDRRLLQEEIFPKFTQRQFDLLLDKMVGEGKLFSSGSEISHQRLDRRLEGEVRAELDRFLDLVRKDKYSPPSPAEIGEVLGLGENKVKKIVKALVDEGSLVRVKQDLYYGREVMEAIKDKVREFVHLHGKITLADLRDQLSTSRKYAQAILEYLDSVGFTRRIEDYRILK